jgi:type IV secretion system protein VirD4
MQSNQTPRPSFANMGESELLAYQQAQVGAFYSQQVANAEAHERARATEQRALQQWEEARNDRAHSNARAERMEARALAQWQQQQEHQARAEYRQVEAHDWHRQSHEQQMRRAAAQEKSEREARAMAARHFNDPRASGVLGNARFASLDDCRRMGMCDSAGYFLGLHPSGAGLYYNGDKHMTVYAGTGSGKGVCSILPNLLWYGRDRRSARSLIVTDVKNGENAAASAEHRARNLGQRVVLLNPARLFGWESVQVNPLDRVTLAPDDEKAEKAFEVACVLAPVIDPSAQNAWVNQGAALLLQAVIAHLAATDPERCTLGRLWEFFTTDRATLKKRLAPLYKSPLPSVCGWAAQFTDWMSSPNQWNAYSSGIAHALQGFTPESPFTRATDRTTFDVRTITKEPTTVYLMMRAGDLFSKGHWAALMVNHLMRVTADHTGPCGSTFLLDEFAQLPTIPRVLDFTNLNRGAGQKLVIYAQDRESLVRKYGEHGAGQFERQSGVLAAWHLRDVALMRELEYLSGRASVKVTGASLSQGGQMGTGISLQEHTRALLQAEDMRQAQPDTLYLLPAAGPMVRAHLVPYYAMQEADRLRDHRSLSIDTKLPALPALKEPAIPTARAA